MTDWAIRRNATRPFVARPCRTDIPDPHRWVEGLVYAAKPGATLFRDREDAEETARLANEGLLDRL